MPGWRLLLELGRVQVFVEEPVFVRLLPDGLVAGVVPAGVRVVPEGRASLWEGLVGTAVFVRLLFVGVRLVLVELGVLSVFAALEVFVFTLLVLAREVLVPVGLAPGLAEVAVVEPELVLEPPPPPPEGV